MVAELRVKAEAAVVAAMDAWCASEMEWGVDDCMLSVADIVRDVTGKDPARRFRGRYTTLLGARRVMGKGGTERAARDSARALHWRRVAPKDAQPGDVGLAPVVVEGRSGTPNVLLAAVICRAPGWFVGRNERGFTALPATKVAAAWAIG